MTTYHQWKKVLRATAIAGMVLVSAGVVSTHHVSAQTVYTSYVLCTLSEQDSSEGNASQERVFVNQVFLYKSFGGDSAVGDNWGKYVLEHYQAKGPHGCQFLDSAGQGENSRAAALKHWAGRNIVEPDWKAASPAQ